jgi:hypothetical protein
MALAHLPGTVKAVIVLATWVAGVAVVVLAIERLWTLRTTTHLFLATMVAAQFLAIVLMTGYATEAYVLGVPPLAAAYFANNEDPLANWRGQVAIIGQALIAIIYFVSKVAGLAT